MPNDSGLQSTCSQQLLLYLLLLLRYRRQTIVHVAVLVSTTEGLDVNNCQLLCTTMEA